MPEMARKMADILALREMLRLGLTAPDIRAILPPLRQLRAAEKELEARSIQILEEERKALLAAEPGARPPAGSGARMRRANAAFQERQEAAWEAVARAVGDEKADGLRRLAGSGPLPGPDAPGVGPRQPLAPPGAPRPLQPRRPLQAPGPGQPAQPPPPDQLEAPDQPHPVSLQDPAPQPPAESAPLPRPSQGFRPPRAGAPGRSPSLPFPPGQPMGPRLSLQELIDLLEQKLAAMRR